MRKGFKFILSLAFLISLLACKTAYASGRIIEIRQIKPDGEIQATVCANEPKQFDAECYLTIKIIAADTKKPENLEVYITSSHGEVDFVFKHYPKDRTESNVPSLRMEMDNSGRAKETKGLYRSPYAYGDTSLLLKYPNDPPYAQLEVTVLPSQ